MVNVRAGALLLLPLLATAQNPPEVGELFASETTARGPVLLAGTGMSVISGSQVAAGKSVATLRLARGGEVRLCPNASLTVSVVDANLPKANQELMLSMDVGSVELDYPLNNVGDILITPDFRLTLAGPGVFHFALGVTNRGDACIKPLRGNSSSIIISEMLGTAVYQVKQDESVMFAGGKLSGRSPLQEPCGCPAPPPVLQAGPEPGPSGAAANPAQAARPAEPGVSQLASNANASAAPKPETLHMEVEAPMVFRGNQPEPAYAVARIRFSSLPNVLLAQENQRPVVLKPDKGVVSAKPRENKGFLGRIKGFFAALFGRK